MTTTLQTSKPTIPKPKRWQKKTPIIPVTNIARTCHRYLIKILSKLARGILGSCTYVTRKRKKTVFLDLDKTLIHSIRYSASVRPPKNFDFIVKYGKCYRYVKKRPYVDEFLNYLNRNNFEIVIFTASKEVYASEVLNKLDPKGLISHRLYRNSCKKIGGSLVKDLSDLGRDLKNVVIIDDNPSFCRLQPENAIQIRPFIDDLQDFELKKLMNSFFSKCDYKDNLKDVVKHYQVARIGN